MGVTFKDKDGKEKMPWQTSWGLSTRSIGALIMAHGDDKGLRLPPILAPIQVVGVPIFRNDDQKTIVMETLTRLLDELKELGIDKGSQNPGSDLVASLTIEQLRKVAEMKQDATLGNSIKEKALEIAGTCVSMGIAIEEKNPKEMQRLIKEGKYDEALR